MILLQLELTARAGFEAPAEVQLCAAFGAQLTEYFVNNKIYI